MAANEQENRFGEALSGFRVSADLTLEVLAEKVVGADQREHFAEYFEKVESGLRLPPRRDLVKLIAQSLELNPEQTDALLVAADYAPIHAGDDPRYDGMSFSSREEDE